MSRRRHDHRIADADQTILQHIRSQTAASFDGFVKAWRNQPFEIFAWSAEPNAEQQRAADGELSTDQGIQIDAAGDEVAAAFSVGEVEAVFGGKSIDRLGGDDRYCSSTARPAGEAAAAVEIAITFDPAMGEETCAA